MYNLGDTTYRQQPKVMSDAVVDAFLDRVLAHSIKHNLPQFHIVLHGGEPLLAGKEFFGRFVAKARAKLLPQIKPVFTMQTNGTLLTEDWCRVLGELGISVGISLDGVRETNDRFRVDHQGKGSYDRIVRGLKIAQESPHLQRKPGMLAVIDINSDPIVIYNEFKQLRARSVDFLLPEANYERLPPAPQGDAPASETPYGDWMVKLFDVWFNDKDAHRPKIRTLFQWIKAILGGKVMADNLGNDYNEVLVVETNGSIEAIDSLKMCGQGFTKAGTNVLTHEFEDAIQTSLARLYHLSHKVLPKQCARCPISEVCGGGFVVHRYSPTNGFDNSSVYCKDLMRIITHIQNTLLKHFPAALLTGTSEVYTYAEARRMLEAPQGEGIRAQAAAACEPAH
jgi:uncharacterized protein